MKLALLLIAVLTICIVDTVLADTSLQTQTQQNMTLVWTPKGGNPLKYSGYLYVDYQLPGIAAFYLDSIGDNYVQVYHAFGNSSFNAYQVDQSDESCTVVGTYNLTQVRCSNR